MNDQLNSNSTNSIGKTYLTVKELAAIYNITERAVRKRIKSSKLVTSWQICQGGGQYLIDVQESFKDNPEKLSEILGKYFQLQIQRFPFPNNEMPSISKAEQEDCLNTSSSPACDFSLEERTYRELSEQEKELFNTLVLDRAASYNRKIADNFIDFFNYASRNDDILSHTKLIQEALEQYKKDYPERDANGWRSYWDAWKIYKQYGVIGIIGKLGNRKGKTKVKNEWLLRYCGILAKQSKISSQDAYNDVKYWAYVNDKDYKEDTFPSISSFERAIDTKKYRNYIESLRNGKKKYSQTSPYIPTTKEGMYAGHTYVGDHSDLDVPVRLEDNTVGWLRLTAFMDMASTKFVGCYVHIDAPSQNHVMKAFYLACTHRNYSKKAIIPERIYVDNGKDLRSKSVTGGKKKQILKTGRTKDKNGNWKEYTIDEKNISLMKNLCIDVDFSKPYNGRAKPIEYYFWVIQNGWSKKQLGYRGNNISNRPDNINELLKNGKLLTLEEAVKSFQNYIENEFNSDKCTIEGKKYESRNKAWEILATKERTVKLEVLEMITGRRSLKKMTRNGITDTVKGKKVTVYGEFMNSDLNSGRLALIIYNREEAEATVYDGVTGQYLGDAEVIKAASRLDKECINIKKHSKRLKSFEKDLKSFKESLIDISYEEHVKNKMIYKQAFEAVEEVEKPNKLIEPVKTQFDNAVNERKKANSEGTFDIKKLAQPEREKKSLIFFEHEKKTIKKQSN